LIAGANSGLAKTWGQRHFSQMEVRNASLE
jgi:hypothetical protein